MLSDKTIFKDKKNLVILLLLTLFVIKLFSEGGRFFFWVASGVFICLIVDFLFSNFTSKKKTLLNSAIISGFIISGIIDYRLPWFTIIAFSSLAIISKHLIKFEHRHIFNPANFSLFIATFLFRLPLSWNIESNTILIVIFGLYFAYSFKKFPHILGFFALFIFFSGILGMKTFSLISWFFIFIMLIEPKTSGFGFLRGFVFGGISGATSILAMKFMPSIDPFISSLFIANLCNPVLERKLKVKNKLI